MVEVAPKTTTICQIEQLCRVIAAVSQGQVFLNPPFSGMLSAQPEEATRIYLPKPHTEATDGLLTAEITEGKLADWLFN